MSKHWTKLKALKGKETKTIYTAPFILRIIKTKTGFSFSSLKKAAVLKQQISKFYPQILSTEDSFYIYDRPLTEAVFVFLIFAVLLGEIGKVDNVAYNSTFAYSVYGTFDMNRPSHL